MLFRSVSQSRYRADIVYIDPPYIGTMNNYFGFYGVIDEYIKSEKIKPFQDNFMDKQQSLYLFEKLFSSLKNFKYWLLSYNSSSQPTKGQIFELLSNFADNIKVIEKHHVYKITGKGRKQSNKEYLFFAENRYYVQNRHKSESA